MKTNRKTLVLSALAALAFGAGAVGSTFALFTSTDETNVTITTGKVNVKMELANLVAKSPASISSDFTVASYESNENNTFKNGGKAEIRGKTIALTNITPGDLVEFDVLVTNESTINIKYRTLFNQVTPDGVDNVASKEFASALNIKAGEKDMSGIVEYRSAWNEKKAGEKLDTVHFIMELPVSATIQDASSNFTFAIEAVQGNAETEGDEFVGKYTTASSVGDIKDAISNISDGEGAAITLGEDLNLTSGLSLSGDANKEVSMDLNGKTLSATQQALTITGNNTVTLTNGTVSSSSLAYSTAMVYAEGNSNLVLDDVTLDVSNDTGTALNVCDCSEAEVEINGGNIKTGKYGFGVSTNGGTTNGAKITIKETKFTSTGNALYFPGQADVELIDCEVEGFTVISGGKTKISGGTYSMDIKEYGVKAGYGNYTKDNPKTDNGLYYSKTGEGKYYFGLDAAVEYMKHAKSSAGCLFDAITVVEERSGYPSFEGLEISGATIGVTNKSDDDIIFGVRYINEKDNTKYDSDNVVIKDDCKSSGVNYLYSGTFFKGLASINE